MTMTMTRRALVLATVVLVLVTSGCGFLIREEAVSTNTTTVPAGAPAGQGLNPAAGPVLTAPAELFGPVPTTIVRPPSTVGTPTVPVRSPQVQRTCAAITELDSIVRRITEVDDIVIGQTLANQLASSAEALEAVVVDELVGRVGSLTDKVLQRVNELGGASTLSTFRRLLGSDEFASTFAGGEVAGIVAWFKLNCPVVIT